MGADLHASSSEMTETGTIFPDGYRILGAILALGLAVPASAQTVDLPSPWTHPNAIQREAIYQVNCSNESLSYHPEYTKACKPWFAKRKAAATRREAARKSVAAAPLLTVRIGMKALDLYKAMEASKACGSHNITTTVNGVHEQWVMDTDKGGSICKGSPYRYIYLDNGIVTAFQQ